MQIDRTSSMSKHKKSDDVFATKDIGGVIRDSERKGSTGGVTESPWFGDATVLFTVSACSARNK